MRSNSQAAVRAGIGILSVLLCALVASRAVYPFDVGHYEAFNWLPAERVLNGESPFAAAHVAPFNMSPYGWVFYFLLAVGVRLFGFDLWWGRMLSVVGFAVCVWAARGIVSKLTDNRRAAAATILAAFAAFAVAAWIAIVRPDFVALAFAFAALRLAFEFEREPGALGWRLAAIIALLAAAFFTKHTILLPAAIVFARLFQLRRFRAALIFAAAYAAIVAAGVAILNWASAGGYVWQHFTHAQKLPFDAENLIFNFLHVAQAPAFLFLIVFLLIFSVQKTIGFERSGGARAALRLLESPNALLAFYFVASFAAAFVSAGRVGGNINYYLENSFAAAIVFGLAWHAFEQRAQTKLLIAAAILLTVGGAFQFARVLRGEYFRWQALAYYREVSATAAKYVKPGDVCVAVFPETVVPHGCQFEFDDFTEYANGWEPELTEIFQREIKTGRFAAIVWYKNDFAEQFPNYRLVPMNERQPEKFYPVYLFVPIARSPE